jgi:transposase-like protein
MSRVIKNSCKSKVKRTQVENIKSMQEYGQMEVDCKVALIQELIPLGLMHVKELLQDEVTHLAGEKYKRNGQPGHKRWGSQRGSVYVLDQKLPIKVQRVRDMENNKEAPLGTYESFQSPRQVDEGLLRRVLHGLSTRNYRECAETIPEAFSLSSSTVSRRYIRASSRKLKELMERRLDGYDFVSLVIDGKQFGDDGMLMALGVTIGGKKVVLGMLQASTENYVVCRDFLRELIDRGLRYEEGLFCLIDGSKGIRKAIKEVFGRHAIVQRCQWHKRENVVSYLPRGSQERIRKKLQGAYNKETYEEAKEALQVVKNELRPINESAVRSMEEGLEETLTIHRLGLYKELKRSFTTTNMIESVMSLIGQKTDKVDYWKNSNQRQRWVATSLLYIEGRLNKASGYKYLTRLREAMRKEIGTAKSVKGDTIAA